jgi:sulfur carrier protein
MEGLGRGVDRPGKMTNSHAPIQPPSSAEDSCVIANGQRIQRPLPCSIEQFLIAQQLLPRSVVVEHNGDAVAPSEFPRRQLRPGDRLEIVKIVAGG